METLQTGTPENWKPLQTERFRQSQIFVFLFKIKLKTPLNQIFSLVWRMFGLEVFHCTIISQYNDIIKWKAYDNVCPLIKVPQDWA